MTDLRDKLSAFLDGELTEAESRVVEEALAADPELMTELEGLMVADEYAKAEFAEVAAEPVPLALASAIRNAPDPEMPAPAAPVAPPRRSPWLAIAATAAFLAIGGAGGYYLGQSQVPVAAAPGWLADIADYHAVYARQGRHLVEVGADESDHIQTWLTAQVGTEVRIPDLASDGLTFEGGRLLVAAGKPVAQLMYRDAEGTVIALCLIQTPTPRDGFAQQTLNGFDMISWGAGTANYVVIGPEGRPDLRTIAEQAATQV
ncbi:MAG: anti-sigma factor [Pseudomonadota bacterium]